VDSVDNVDRGDCFYSEYSCVPDGFINAAMTDPEQSSSKQAAKEKTRPPTTANGSLDCSTYNPGRCFEVILLAADGHSQPSSARQMGVNLLIFEDWATTHAEFADAVKRQAVVRRSQD
jgi:hypothetical protein